LSGDRTGLHSGEYNTVKMHFMTYASRRFVLEKHFFMTNEAPAMAQDAEKKTRDGSAIRKRCRQVLACRHVWKAPQGGAMGQVS